LKHVKAIGGNRVKLRPWNTAMRQVSVELVSAPEAYLQKDFLHEDFTLYSVFWKRRNHLNSSLPTVQECSFTESFKKETAAKHLNEAFPCRRQVRMEHCRNPWNGRCKNKDITVYIHFRGEKLPICRRCWTKIAEKDLEW